MGQYAEQFVRGLQEGPDPRYIKVIATCKHLVAYSVEDTPPDRHHFDAVVTVQDLMDTYLPAFHACAVRAGAKAVMCSYNKLNGIPACAHEGLLTGVPVHQDWSCRREGWVCGGHGHPTPDCLQWGTCIAISGPKYGPQGVNQASRVLKGKVKKRQEMFLHLWQWFPCVWPPPQTS